VTTILTQGNYSKAIEAIELASTHSQRILKSEWERVKRGEKSFQLARNWVMPLIMTLSLVFITTLLFSSPEPVKPPLSMSMSTKFAD
jgi:hypothetical protein